jgi:hypothetical protein
VIIGLLFAALTFFVIPVLFIASNGTIIDDPTSFELSKMTLGNMGEFPDVGINATRQEKVLLMMRRRVKVEAGGITTYMDIRDTARMVSYLDLSSTILLTLCSCVLLYKRWPEKVKSISQKVVTAANFTLEIDFLPPLLPPMEHDDYADKLKMHLNQLNMMTRDKNAIVEVCLARNWDGAIQLFIEVAGSS